MNAADSGNDPYSSPDDQPERQPDPYAASNPPQTPPPGQPYPGQAPPPPQPPYPGQQAPSGPSPYPGQPQFQGQVPAQQPGWPPQQPSSGMAVASLVLGIVGVFFSWFLFGIPSILAVIFGHVGLSKVKSGTGGGQGMAIAGLVTGYIVIGIWLLLFILGVAFWSEVTTMGTPSPVG